MKKVAFIYWFAFHNIDSASVRYRAKYPLEFLNNTFGINSHLVFPGYTVPGILKFLRVYSNALLFPKLNSIIIIQRVRSDFIYAYLLKLLVKLRPSIVVYDLDDADYLEHTPKNIYFFIRNCAAVLVGSKELARNLGPLNSNVVINTSPVPKVISYKIKKNPRLHIGWIGCFGGDHKESLIKDFFPALTNLPFEVTLTLMGIKYRSDEEFIKDYFQSFTKVSINIPKNIDWNNEIDVQKRIVQFDIGIATLQNNELHRSKSAFKLKQYLNCGVPVLSSDIPENNFFVKEGINGFLCSTPKDFEQRIIQIREMSNRDYSKLIFNARKSVVNFDLFKYCKTLSLLNNVKHQSKVIISQPIISCQLPGHLSWSRLSGRVVIKWCLAKSAGLLKAF